MLGFIKLLGKFNLSYCFCFGVFFYLWVINVGFWREEKGLDLGRIGMIYFVKMVIDR